MTDETSLCTSNPLFISYHMVFLSLLSLLHSILDRGHFRCFGTIVFYRYCICMTPSLSCTINRDLSYNVFDAYRYDIDIDHIHVKHIDINNKFK